MTAFDDAKARADELRRKLRQLDQLTGKTNERAKDADRKRQTRAAAKVVVIPPCADRERRLALEADDAAWLRYFFPELFWYDFTGQQTEMITAIRAAIVDGGDQALAASRGEGKTKIFERQLLKYVLQGVVGFAVLFAATGANAEDSLDAIKNELEVNERLRALYPEVCVPVAALENTPSRAHFQLVTGNRHDNGEPFRDQSSRFSWCGKQITLPRVPGAPAAGAIFATRGLDAAVRGLNKGNRRPDVAGIDDPDTEETAASKEQALKLEKRIDRAIGGMGGQQKSVARVMLTTLQNRICVSYRFCDPTQKHSWRGRKFRFLITKPERLDLWDEYVQLRKADWVDGTSLADAFYADRFDVMNAGAVVANPHRHTAQQRTALQFYFDQVARLGEEAVATEYDNDPPEETGPVESGISAHRIQRQLNGLKRKELPPGCSLLTQGIDCRKQVLHWVVRAWLPSAQRIATIDYGVTEVRGLTQTSEDAGVDLALVAAIRERMDQLRDEPYRGPEGQPFPVRLTLVDSGWRTPAIYIACRQVGLGIMPSKGFGRSAGCVGANFSDVQRSTRDRHPGDGWFLSRQDDLWLVCMDADRWKAWEHDRWLTDPLRPGALTLWGERGKPGRLSDDEKQHFSYAKHLTAEVEAEEIHKGALRRGWKSKSDTNHYFDASYQADVAASVCGIRFLKAEPSALAAEVIVKSALELPPSGGGDRTRW